MESPRVLIDASTFSILEANPEAAKLYRFSQTEFVHKRLNDLFLQRDRDLIRLLPELPSDLPMIVRQRDSGGTEFTVYVALKNHGETPGQFWLELNPIERSEEEEGAFHSGNSQFITHINQSKLGLVIWNHRLEMVECSEVVSAITGLSKDEVCSQSIYDFNLLSSAEQPGFKKSIWHLLQSREVNFSLDKEIPDQHGESRWVRLNFSAIWDGAKLNSLMCFVEEFTFGYLESKILKEKELRYRALFENSTESILIYKRGGFFDCNTKAQELFGCSKDEILDRGPEFFSPELQPNGESSAELAAYHIKKAFEEGVHSFEWQHQNINGVPIDTEICLSVVKVEEEAYIQALVKDVTQSKKYEQQILKSEQLFKGLFTNSPSAIVMVDRENKVEMVNESFVKIFGFSEEELYGQDLDKMIVAPEEYDLAPKMPGVGLDGSEQSMEVIRYTKSGEARNLIVVAVPVYFEGSPLKGFGIYVDITELKEKEQHLEDSLTEKRVLLAEVHHRVKNNLALIASLFQLQSLNTDGEEMKLLLNESISRIRSIAISHELLYQTESLSRIPADTYLDNLISHLNAVLTELDVSGSSDSFDLNINQAIPFGLLVSELFILANNLRITQEIKKVSVKLIKSGDSIEIIFDGFNKNPFELLGDEEEESKCLSATLVKTLIKQLKAESYALDHMYGLKFKASNTPGPANKSLL